MKADREDVVRVAPPQRVVQRWSRRVAFAPWLLLAPALLGLLLFLFLPTIVSFVAGFFDIPLSGAAPRWVGLDNFIDVLGDRRTHQAFWNTIIYCILTIVPAVVIGLLLALLVETLGRGKAFVSTLLFLPLTANLVAMAVVFRWIFSPRGGFANQLIGMVGVGPIDFLGDKDTALITVAAVGVWRSVSFAMVLFMAGLTTIPRGVHEAAAMDGLRGLKKTILITVPMLRPIMVLVIILIALQSVQVFDTINVMTGGGPDGSSETMLLLIWRLGFSYFDLGKASALTMLVVTALLLLGLVRRRQPRKVFK